MASSIQRFMALGFAESDALELNRSLLDIAGSLGMSQSEAALLGTALAQVKAKGVASMEELRQQIAEKGVPVFDLLAQKMGVTEAEIIKMVSAGKIGADIVIEAFQNLEGPLERFRGGADRMGQTAGGLFARLKQEQRDLWRLFSEQLLPELKPFLDEQIQGMEKWKAVAKQYGQELADMIGNVRALFSELSFGEMFQLAGLMLKEALLDALNAAAKGVAALVTAFNDDRFGTAMEKAAWKFRQAMLEGIAEVFHSMANLPGIGDKMAMAGFHIQGQAYMDNRDAKKNPFLRSEKGPGVLELIAKAFREQPQMFGLSKKDQERLQSLIQRVLDRRSQQQRENENRTEEKTPAKGNGDKPQQEKKAFDPSALIGGGLAGAISRISGGPGTILMNKQLQVQEGIRDAAQKTAESAKKLLTK